MVRIEYFGAWEDENAQAVREIVAAKIKENMKISVLSAYFEEEFFGENVNGKVFSEDRASVKKSAPTKRVTSADYSAAGTRAEEKALIISKMQGGAGVRVQILIYPAGNGRTRRLTAREIVENITLQTGINEKNIFVTIDAPPQERRSYAEER